jgi:anti-anti-sigma regulatory factor
MLQTAGYAASPAASRGKVAALAPNPLALVATLQPSGPIVRLKERDQQRRRRAEKGNGTMTSHAVDELVVLQPNGDFLEGVACDDLEHELYSLAEQGRRVIVDLSRTRVLTAHCLGVLARAQRLASANGGGLALCGAAGPQRWLLDVTHLAGALPLYASEAEAVAHLQAGRAVA